MPATQSSDLFRTVDEDVRRGLGENGEGTYAGAVVLITRAGQVVHAAAFGNAQSLYVDQAGAAKPMATPRKMEINTHFDMASITKVEATTAAIMHLVSSDRLRLDDRLGRLLPEFAHTDKANITVEQLLTHRSGLWEWQATWLHRDAKGAILPYLAQLPLRYPVGARRAYSDLGFMLLGAIVTRITAMPLDQYVRRELFAHLDMNDTTYLPPMNWRASIAATSQGDRYQKEMAETGKPYPVAPEPPPHPFSAYRTNFLVGEANDANAWLGWGGVAGHAGLFSTALDLARYAQALLNGGCYGAWRLASPSTIATFEQTPFDPQQALGFHKSYVPGVATPFFGHEGFTGTQFVFSPALQMSVIFLTNRLHHEENGRPPAVALGTIQAAVIKDAADAVASRIERGSKAGR